MSESSVPVASASHVYRPVARTGGVLPPVETTSSSNDPPTSLSLSLPGVDSSEVSNRANESAHAAPPLTAIPLLPIMAASAVSTAAAAVPAVAQPLQRIHDLSAAAAKQKGAVPPFNFSAELLAVMQEMIRKEVRSYMAGLEQQNGMCFQAADDGFRNASVKRIGISRIDS